MLLGRPLSAMRKQAFAKQRVALAPCQDWLAIAVPTKITTGTPAALFSGLNAVYAFVHIYLTVVSRGS